MPTTTYSDVQDVEMECVFGDEGYLVLRVITQGVHFGRHVRSLKANRKLGAYFAGQVMTIQKKNGHYPHCRLVGGDAKYWEISEPKLPRGSR